MGQTLLEGRHARESRRRLTLIQLMMGVARRLSWGIADQGMSSISNFAVNIYVARTVSAAEYGAFSLAYVTYGFALNASRGLSTDPLMVRFSNTDLPTWRRAVASCSGTAVAVGLTLGTVMVLAGLQFHGATRSAFLALGLTLPGLLLQDSWRFAFFALGRGGQAFLNDTIWVAVLLPELVILRLTGHADVFWLIFAWGSAATVAAGFGPLQARLVPRLSDAWGWIRRQRDLGPRYLVEGTANSAAGQLRNYGVGLILGLAALGYVQAASTLMGPFMVVFFGMALVALPEANRALRQSRHHMQRFCVMLSAGMALLGLVWGTVLLIALPRGLGNLILGSLWHPTYPLVLPMTLTVAITCLSAGAGMGLHALGAAKRSLRAMVLTGISTVVCGLIGASLGGAVGTIRGSVVSSTIGVLIFWWELRRASGEYDNGLLPSSAMSEAPTAPVPTVTQSDGIPA